MHKHMLFEAPNKAFLCFYVHWGDAEVTKSISSSYSVPGTLGATINNYVNEHFGTRQYN